MPLKYEDIKDIIKVTPATADDWHENIRQDIEVLPADPPNKLKLGWTVREYIGPKIIGESGMKKLKDGQNYDEEDILKSKTDIYGGREIYTLGLYGWIKGHVIAHEDGRFTFESGGLIGILNFDEDDRHCWVCGGFINKKCIGKLKGIVDE